MNGMGRALTAEFIGTFALIFMGAGAGTIAGMGSGGSLITVALAHGLTIMIMASAYGHISGIHINPAVTIGTWAAGKFEAAKVGPYIVAQLLGGIVAAFVLRFAISGGVDVGLGATVINYSQTTLAGAFVLEMIAAFFLVNAVLNAGISGKGGSLAPLGIGLTLGVSIMFFGPLTGASLNPARTVGPAVAAGIYNDIWVYIVATIVGGIIAGLLYRYYLEEA
ncbi:MAG: aquaporin [Caldilineaceae bacterium]|nr:aquaporin [Caldilineaceae bacterium]MDE0183376.1 aquaporin [Caldilineaceae bacterium]MDE0429255.1 aquaporin [Caldilineaceae bacterium]